MFWKGPDPRPRGRPATPGRDEQGFPRSYAGAAYAALWALVIGARLGFTYAASHSPGLQAWLGTRHIGAATLTDALIFMAAGMLLARTARRQQARTRQES